MPCVVPPCQLWRGCSVQSSNWASTGQVPLADSRGQRCVALLWLCCAPVSPVPVGHILSPLATSLKDSCTVMAWLESALPWELTSSQLCAQLPCVAYVKSRRYYSLFSVYGVRLSRVWNLCVHLQCLPPLGFVLKELESDPDPCRGRRQTMPELLCLALFPENWVPSLCVRLCRLFTRLPERASTLRCPVWLLARTAAGNVPQQPTPGALAPSRCEELRRPEAV